MKKKILILICAVVVMTSCNSEKNKTTSKSDTAKLQIETPDFSADSAFSFVKSQTDFGPRVPNSEAHKKCARFLKESMEKYCDQVIMQSFNAKTYDGNKLNCWNIIASFAPEKEKRILLAAHWDSRHIADHDPIEENRSKPISGANDGASGVGVLMEVARQLNLKNPTIGVDIIFFDAEDYGTPNSENIPGDWWCLGSQYWAKNPHKQNYKADYGILLDMVGASNATFYHEGISSHFAPAIVSKIWGVSYRLGFGKYFINEGANTITDDHYYINTLAKIPMIDIIHQERNSETGFYPYWHTTQDNIDNIDSNTLEVVGKTVLSVIYEEK